MATKFECDRCNKQFNRSSETRSIEYPSISRYSPANLEVTMSKDLCKECFIDLNEFMTPLVKEKK